MEIYSETILEVFDNYLNASLILDCDTAIGVINELIDRDVEFIDDDYDSIASILTDDEIILIEKRYSEETGERYFIQELFYEDDVQASVYNDIVFIQETVEDCIDFDRIETEQLVLFERYGILEDEEIEGELDEETEDLIQSLVDGFFEDLNDEDDNRNFVELLKSYLLEAYEFGLEDASEVIDEDDDFVTKGELEDKLKVLTDHICKVIDYKTKY